MPYELFCCMPVRILNEGRVLESQPPKAESTAVFSKNALCFFETRCVRHHYQEDCQIGNRSSDSWIKETKTSWHWYEYGQTNRSNKYWLFSSGSWPTSIHKHKCHSANCECANELALIISTSSSMRNLHLASQPAPISLTFHFNITASVAMWHIQSGKQVDHINSAILQTLSSTTCFLHIQYWWSAPYIPWTTQHPAIERSTRSRREWSNIYSLPTAIPFWSFSF